MQTSCLTQCFKCHSQFKAGVRGRIHFIRMPHRDPWAKPPYMQTYLSPLNDRRQLTCSAECISVQRSCTDSNGSGWDRFLDTTSFALTKPLTHKQHWSILLVLSFKIATRPNRIWGCVRKLTFAVLFSWVEEDRRTSPVVLGHWCILWIMAQCAWL